MNLDGTERRILAEQISLMDSSSWSPDGQQILYTAHIKEGVGLYVINADGSDPRLLVQNQAVSFYSVWQPQP
jgi:Tol biopolymer transport system component